MYPVAQMLDQIGYHSLEMWGGATFDSAMRFLGEDPWERLRKLKQAIRKTPLQMLLRGQNILGYKHYPDDVVVEFVKRSVGNGIDVVRIFDALNDLRNLEVAVKATKQEGAHAQIAVSYTISPVHNTAYYVKLAGDIVSMGADSVCIKDMAGLLSPFDAFDLVSQLKKAYPELLLQMHTHYTSGMGSMTYLKAVEAGADVIDTAISPFALGTSQPPTETMVAVLRDTPYDTGLDLEALDEIATYFKKIKPKYSKLEQPSFIDTNVLKYQIPGGMLSNLMAQLAEQKASDKFQELLHEVPRVREDLGFPPLVTPTSQIVGTQAVFNVVTGIRISVIIISNFSFSNTSIALRPFAAVTVSYGVSAKARVSPVKTYSSSSTKRIFFICPTPPSAKTMLLLAITSKFYISGANSCQVKIKFTYGKFDLH